MLIVKKDSWAINYHNGVTMKTKKDYTLATQE